MARKTVKVEIKDKDSRDNGRVYKITEKDAYSAEWWACRALGGMIKAGIAIPDTSSLSTEVLFHYGIASLLKIEPYLLKELMDEMMECVEVVPSPQKEPNVTRKLLPSDIEETATLMEIRKKTLELHIDFFMKGVTQTTE